MADKFDYWCECRGIPHHHIPGMTTKLYHALTLKWGVDYLIQVVDCPRALEPGQVVVEQTDIYRVVGPKVKP